MNTIIPRPPRLLCLCDSPTVHTGFGRVAQSLIRRWKPYFHRIDIYAINHDGDSPMPESEWSAPAVRLLRPRHPWYATESLQRFLNLILSGEYTHVWIMQDLFLLSPNGFPGAFRQVCPKEGVRSLLYYPVEGALDPEWTRRLGLSLLGTPSRRPTGTRTRTRTRRFDLSTTLSSGNLISASRMASRACSRVRAVTEWPSGWNCSETG